MNAERSARKALQPHTPRTQPARRREERVGPGRHPLGHVPRPLSLQYGSSMGHRAQGWGSCQSTPGLPLLAAGMLVLALVASMWTVVGHVAATLRGGATAERAWRRHGLGHFGGARRRILVGAGPASRFAGRTSWWEFHQLRKVDIFLSNGGIGSDGSQSYYSPNILHFQESPKLIRSLWFSIHSCSLLSASWQPKWSHLVFLPSIWRSSQTACIIDYSFIWTSCHTPKL